MGHRAVHQAAFVGREHELRTLTALLDDAQRGRGGVALVIGEPGIGKSALVDKLAATASGRDMLVAWGRCSETDAPAFWPWRQAMPTFDIGTLADASETASRAELFARVAEQLAAVANPALILLEDLHWADPASLALLRFVADASPGFSLLVVATTRGDPAEAGAETTATLQSLPAGVTRLELSGLGVEAVADIAAGELGHRPSDELATRITERCGGNPFFVHEVARLQASRGNHAAPTVPAGVQQVLERRLTRLSPACRELLTAAAVAGEPEPDLLAEMCGQARTEVLHRLSEAVTARLLRSDGTHLDFAHSLVREAVYAQQSPATLGELHRRVAEVLETRRAGAESHAARLAAHWRRAGGADGRRKAAAHALTAAREARERLGHEQAADLYEWALEAPPDDVLTLRIEQGEARVLAGELVAGRDALRQAAREARRENRPHDVARATLGIGLGGFEVALRDDEQVALLEHALAKLDSPGDERLRAATLARLSVASAWQQPAGERAELADKSVELARAGDDAETEVAALAAWCDARSGPDDTEARLEQTDRMIEVARHAGDTTGLLLARRLRVVALAELGEFATVDAEVDAYARASDRLRLPIYAWLVPVWRGARALMSGDIETARRHIAEAEKLAARADSINAATVVRLLEANLLHTLGEYDAAAAAADHQKEIIGPYYDDLAVLAIVYASAGREHEARRLVRQKLAAGIERPKDAEYLAELWLLGEAALVLGEDDAAAAVYRALRPYAHRWVINSVLGTCLGVAAHQVGRLAARLGECDTARARLEQARAAHYGAGAAMLVEQTERALASLEPREHVGAADGDVRTVTAPEAKFRRSGRIWQLQWGGTAATVPDTKGMRDLAALLAVPGRDVHVLDLVEAAGGPSAATAGGHTGERLDTTARAAYRQRLTDIAAELDEAEADSDTARAGKLRHEQDFLTGELSGALGLGGRARTDGDPVERARKAVTMRIRTALKAIAEVSPAMARHLDRSVTTGRLCCYRPEHEVGWRL